MMLNVIKTGAVCSLLLCATAFAAESAAVKEEQPQSAISAAPSAPQPSAAQAEGTTSASSATPSSPPSAAPRRAGNDRLDLDTTVVTGNRELPKVLYIVPWKKADIGDLPAQPFNTLLDEALTPVDRDVFRREVTYYGAIAADAPAPAAQPGGSEK